MKFYVCSFLFTTAITSLSAFGANMLYNQDFETPLADNPEISWNASGREVAVTLVRDNPKNGSWSARGNFNENVVDPLTNDRGQPNPHFDIRLDQVPALKNWLPSAKNIYISWWFKLDACHWKGTTFSNSNPLKASAKFAYLNMNNNPQTSYYLSLGGGNDGDGILQTNSGTWMRSWETLYKRASLYTATGKSFGTDGKWHKLSFHISTESDGKKYMRWWIDDILMRADSMAAGGKFEISKDYIIDTIGFWHTAQGIIDKSTSTGTGNHCNGWQIDSLQVWDDVPARPLPPNT